MCQKAGQLEPKEVQNGVFDPLQVMGEQQDVPCLVLQAGKLRTGDSLGE